MEEAENRLKMEQSVKSLAFSKCQEFPALRDDIYLDHAGATLVSRTQLEAHHADILTSIYGNPHSRSASSQLTTDTIDQIRYRILQHFGTTDDEYSLIFTAGCTAALKLIAETFDYHGKESCCCSCTRCHGNKDSFNGVEGSGLTSVIYGNSSDDTTDIPIKESIIDHNDDTQASIQMKESIQRCNNRGSFSYLLDNHTSVQGMREIAFEKAGCVQCLDSDSNEIIQLKNVLFGQQGCCPAGNHLFAYPAQSNFSGKKYPLQWISFVQQGQMEWQATVTDSRSCQCQGRFYIVLDAASLVSTSALDLGNVKPDFVALSFYKMFGYPTGLGALLVRNSSAHVLKKTYYGGGTVAVSLPTQPFHMSRSSLSEKFEDGTVSFLDIISLRHGFDALQKLAGGISSISQHTFNLAQYFHHILSTCYHATGTRLAEIYCDGQFEDIWKQGAIVSFNLIRANGDYIGFSEVDKLAQLYNIHIRTGCFCNIGACQKYLNISDEQIKQNFDAGHVCGDDKDLIDGKPTGAVRVSFGYMSTLEDAQRCLQFIVDCFLEIVPKPVYLDKNSSAEDNPSRNQNLISYTFGKEINSLENKYSQETDSNVDKDVEEKSAHVHQKNMINQNFESEKSRKHMSIQNGIDVENIGNMHKSDQSTDTEKIRKMESAKNEVYKACEDRHLSEIYLYPVKSCAAFKVKEWPLCDRGLLYDREWMVVTESGIAMSQKRESRLCHLKPTIDLNKQRLLLDFPGMETICISLHETPQHETEASLCSSKVCGDRIQSYDCGNEVGEWLSEALCRSGCRLIRQASGDNRVTKLKNNKAEDTSKLSLANESQYLLISRNSVTSLHEKILKRREDGDTQESFDIDNLVDRFRGNLVVSGCDPFEEESWKNIQIGKLHFRSQGTCARCQMVCLDQQTGERSKEPLKTLAVWRGTKIPFGIHLCGCFSEHNTQPTIKVGDPIFIS